MKDICMRWAESQVFLLFSWVALFRRSEMACGKGELAIAGKRLDHEG